MPYRESLLGSVKGLAAVSRHPAAAHGHFRRVSGASGCLVGFIAHNNDMASGWRAVGLLVFNFARAGGVYAPDAHNVVVTERDASNLEVQA
jgi:hypothetical protein